MLKITRYVLLAVVVASVIWLVLPKGSAQRSGAAGTAAPAENVAYYFHRTARCHTCLTIESYAHDAIFHDFTSELRAGKLLFMPTNVEVPGNEHFVSDYELVSQALVLIRYDGDSVAAWKNLDRVWDLVGDSAQFAQYVHDEVTGFLESAP